MDSLDVSQSLILGDDEEEDDNDDLLIITAVIVLAHEHGKQCRINCCNAH